MAFVDRLSDPQVNKWFALFIEGIPQVFTSQELPPTFYTGGRSEIIALDVSGGINPPAQTLNRKAGVATPTSMSFRIGPDDKDGTLRKLFATRNADATVSALTTTLEWNEANTMDVGDASLFDAGGGEVYIGRETISFLQTDVPGNSLDRLTRGLYGSVAWKFEVDPDTMIGTRLVSTHPAVWQGRTATLHIGICNNAGQPLDTGFDGDDSAVMWKGTISGLKANSDWKSWSMACSSLDKAIDTQVAGHQPSGRISWTNSSWNNPEAVEIQSAAGYIIDGQNEVEIKLRPPGQTEFKDINTVTVSVSPFGYSSHIDEHMYTSIADQLTAAAVAGTGDIPPAAVFTSFNASLYNASLKDDPYDERFKLRIAVDDSVSADWGMRIDVNNRSILRSLGWEVGSVGFADPVETVGTRAVFFWDQPKGSPFMYVSPQAESILVYEETVQNERDFGAGPGTGFAKLTVGEDQEIIRYTGVSVVATGPPRIVLLSGLTRGYCGTKALEYYIGAEEVDQGSGTYEATNDPPKIEGCLAFQNTGLLSMFLQLAMGTGGNVPRNATYDTAGVPEFTAAGMDADWFDIPTFEGVDASLNGVFGTRQMAWSRPFNLKDWIADELAAIGWVLISRQTENGFQITLDQVTEPAIVGFKALGAGDIHLDPWPEIDTSVRDMANSVELKLDWNVAKEEFGRHLFVVNDKRSQVDHGTTNPLKLEIQGMQKDKTQATHAAITLSAKLLAHFSEPYEIVTLAVKKDVWAWRPGDNVLVTLADVPNDDGSAGWVDEPMLLVAVSPALAGTGNTAACIVTLLHMPGRRHSYYVPSGDITSFNVGNKTVTIAANAYSEATETNPITGQLANDVDWFEADMLIDIAPLGEAASGTNNLIVSKAGQILTLTDALPGSIAVGDVIYYSDYTTAITIAQKNHVYIADINGVLGPANDLAFQYGA